MKGILTKWRNNFLKLQKRNIKNHFKKVEFYKLYFIGL